MTEPPARSRRRIDADGSGERPIGDPSPLPTRSRISRPTGSAVASDHLEPKAPFFAFMIRDLATEKDRRVFTTDRDLEHPPEARTAA